MSAEKNDFFRFCIEIIVLFVAKQREEMGIRPIWNIWYSRWNSTEFS